MKSSNRILTGFLLFVLFGCSSTKLRRPVSLPLPSLSSWPTVYRQNFNEVKTLKSDAHLTVETPEFSASFTAGFLYAAPDTLHLKAEGPFGIDLGEFFIGKNRFLLYNQFNNQFICGSLEDDYYNTFLQTNLTLKQVKNALIGYIPLPPDLKLVDQRHGVFSARVGEEKWRFVVNPKTGTLQQWEIAKNNQVILKQKFGKYRKMGNIVFPALVRIINPQKKERISVFHKNIRLNQSVNPDSYRIKINGKVKQLMMSR